MNFAQHALADHYDQPRRIQNIKGAICNHRDGIYDAGCKKLIVLLRDKKERGYPAEAENPIRKRYNGGKSGDPPKIHVDFSEQQETALPSNQDNHAGNADIPCEHVVADKREVGN